MPEFLFFTGNCPGNVSKDAKFAIRSGKNGPVVALTYRARGGEKWHVTTKEHPQLVEMVNEVKVTKGEGPNGPFYINEYGQVIVPVGESATYYLAGEYDEPLRFEIEGKTLSGDAIDLEGNRVKPGETWVGPHPGIPYVLSAGAKDVYYEISPRPNVTKKVLLSDAVGQEKCQALSRRIRDVKGFEGGRFYVNEWRRIFAPLKKGSAFEYVYIGELKVKEGWFPKPSPAEAQI